MACLPTPSFMLQLVRKKGGMEGLKWRKIKTEDIVPQLKGRNPPLWGQNNAEAEFCKAGQGSGEAVIHSAREEKATQLPQAEDAINESRVHILLYSTGPRLKWKEWFNLPSLPVCFVCEIWWRLCACIMNIHWLKSIKYTEAVTTIWHYTSAPETGYAIQLNVTCHSRSRTVDEAWKKFLHFTKQTYRLKWSKLMKFS